jgi:hypothetical protein
MPNHVLHQPRGVLTALRHHEKPIHRLPWASATLFRTLTYNHDVGSSGPALTPPPFAEYVPDCSSTAGQLHLDLQ